MPLTLSCGSAVYIRPEDLGFVGMDTDATIFDSRLWIEGDVLETIHNLVGDGTTF